MKLRATVREPLLHFLLIELRGLIDTYVHDEVSFREGKALGLDRDDAVIKRRARQIVALPFGTWSGPLLSGFGVHLVRVNARAEPRLPPLAEVRATIARAWENNRRQQARNASYAKLLAGFDIVRETRLPVASKP